MGNNCKGTTARLQKSCHSVDDLDDCRKHPRATEKRQNPHRSTTPNTTKNDDVPTWEPAPVAPMEDISAPKAEVPYGIQREESEDFLRQSRPADTNGMMQIYLEGARVPHSADVWVKASCSVAGLREAVAQTLGLPQHAEQIEMEFGGVTLDHDEVPLSEVGLTESCARAGAAILVKGVAEINR